MRCFFDSLGFFSLGASGAAGGADLRDLVGRGVSLVTNYFIVEYNIGSEEGTLVLVERFGSSDQLSYDGLALLEQSHRCDLLLVVPPVALQ